MAESDLEPVGRGAGDPVSAVRTWLARQGLPVPEGGAAGPDPQPALEGQSPAPRARSSSRSAGSAGAKPGAVVSGADGDEAGGADGDEADPAAVARTIVLRKLAAQARTRHELATALAARHVPEEVASEVLNRFQEVGLVDDAGFARDWVASRQQRRHLSASALRRELQTKGVDRDLVDAAVGQVASEDELAAAQALAEKKVRSMAGLPREVQYRRLAGVLARRGFSGGVTATVIGGLLDAPHED